MTSTINASSPRPANPLAVRRSPILLLIMRTMSAARWSFSRMALVSVSLRVCSRLMGLVDALGVALPLLVPQHELLDLAGRRLGQVAELDGSRALEVGDVLPAELDGLLLGGPRAGLEGDEGLGPLAPLRVGDGDHRALHDGRVLGHRLLDLDRGDVLAARDDDVLLAVTQLDVAVGVPYRQVAGVEPATPERLCTGVGLFEISLHHVVTPHDHLAERLAVHGDVAHRVVDHADEVGDHVALALAGGLAGHLLHWQPVPV